MTDLELLTLAAKAAGIRIIRSRMHEATCKDILIVGPDGYAVGWQPLRDDGDAFRLAVKLNLHVMRFENMATARPLLLNWGCDERDGGDSYAATRCAIVRAAAEIGGAA